MNCGLYLPYLSCLRFLPSFFNLPLYRSFIRSLTRKRLYAILVSISFLRPIIIISFCELCGTLVETIKNTRQCPFLPSNRNSVCKFQEHRVYEFNYVSIGISNRSHGNHRVARINFDTRKRKPP